MVETITNQWPSRVTAEASEAGYPAVRPKGRGYDRVSPEQERAAWPLVERQGNDVGCALPQAPQMEIASLGSLPPH